jgi:hypothetical protein
MLPLIRFIHRPLSRAGGIAGLHFRILLCLAEPANVFRLCIVVLAALQSNILLKATKSRLLSHR